MAPPLHPFDLANGEEQLEPPAPEAGTEPVCMSLADQRRERDALQAELDALRRESVHTLQLVGRVLEDAIAHHASLTAEARALGAQVAALRAERVGLEDAVQAARGQLELLAGDLEATRSDRVATLLQAERSLREAVEQRNALMVELGVLRERRAALTHAPAEPAPQPIDVAGPRSRRSPARYATAAAVAAALLALGALAAPAVNVSPW